MARTFNGSSDELQSAAGVTLPSGYPISICVTSNCDLSVPSDEIMVNLFDDGGSENPRIQFGISDDAGTVLFVVRVQFSNSDAFSASLDIDTPYTAGTWHNYSATITSTDIDLFFDGTGTTSNSSHSVTFPAIDRVDVGHLSNFGIGHFDGEIAEVAVWDRVIEDGEIDAIALGFSPENHKNSLVNHWRLDGTNSPETDQYGDIDLTVSGASKADHPYVIRPVSTFVNAFSAAAQTFFVTITASTVGTAAVVKQANKVVTATSTGVASVVKQVNKIITTTTTGTAAAIKQVNKTIAATTVGTAAVTALKTVLITIAATATGVSAVVKLVDKEFAATATGVASAVKQVNKIVSTTTTGVTGVVKQVNKIITTSTVGTAALTAGKIFNVAIAATATGVAAIATLKITGGQVVSQLWRRICRR